MKEETFIILKPDAISRDLVEPIVRCFQQIGEIKWVTGRHKSIDWCRQHYEHIASNSELIGAYAIMEAFMSRELLIGFGLSGFNIIKQARAITGSTDTAKARPGTIRGNYGIVFPLNRPMCYNLVHVADSSSAVLRETALFLDRSTDYDFGITTHRPHQSQTGCDDG